MPTGAGNDDTGQDEEMIDNGGREEAGHGGEKGAGHGGGEGAGWRRRERHGLHATEFVGTKFNRAGPSCSSIASQGDKY